MLTTVLCRLRRLAAVFCILLGAALCAPAHVAHTHAASAHTYLGPAVRIGRGKARVMVVTDGRHQPTAIGLVFTPGMLEGLPAKPGKDPELDHYYFLAFPAGAPATGFDHLMIDWHPLGHPPKNIYTVPHFDFHFYLVDQKTQLAYHYVHPETPDMTGVNMPDPALLPAGYFIPPGTQVNEMGVHAIPQAAPELHGKPFTNTFIYGYAGGQLVFVEPMITLAYLKGRPDYSAPLPAPSRYSYPGYYPTHYSVRYDAGRHRYSVMLEGLKPWQTDKLVKPASL
jgi:Hypothetical protein TTHB210